MKNIILSPPFGYWLLTDWATSVVGTFTLAERKGKWFQTIRTLRPIKGGWRNQIGLRNSGLQNESTIKRIKNLQSKQKIILSVHASNDGEWEDMYEALNYCQLTDSVLELNVSCPNVHNTSVSTHVLELFQNTFTTVIVKLPPILEEGMELYRQAKEANIIDFHCCNTIPTTKGGISGTPLKPLSLRMIRKIREEDTYCHIIGGGGIYTPEDVHEYMDAGVDSFSLATIFFTPWKIKKVVEEINKVSRYDKKI